ncbi:hypothetical protein [Azotobacter chroococcum]|uniref:hypothetical protein n=1 Tax=Azotobacter chroococcum TaxID=353 RepID=UPI0011872B6E|nr:hypothetical protein [Azotobacter chroococcum]
MRTDAANQCDALSDRRRAFVGADTFTADIRADTFRNVRTIVRTLLSFLFTPAPVRFSPPAANLRSIQQTLVIPEQKPLFKGATNLLLVAAFALGELADGNELLAWCGQLFEPHSWG